MSATSAQRKRIGKTLPHELLRMLYLDSRVPMKQLGGKLGFSGNTAARYLSMYGRRYGIRCTIDVDMGLLGFSESRIVAIRFENKVPEIGLLKRVLEKEPFVQNAYVATGDFHLVLHVVASDHLEYNRWLYRMRFGFSRYKPRVMVSTLDGIVEGFLPARPALIGKSGRLSSPERKLLCRLIEDSRTRVKDLAKVAGISEMGVIYTISKLKERGVIRGFTSCIQNPEKRLFLFYMVNLIPNEDHHPKALLRFLDRIIDEENPEDVTNDYALVCETSGSSDILFFCNFRDGITMSRRGPDFLKEAWKSESPAASQCILTDVIVGMWPFSKNGYVNWERGRELERKAKPEDLPVY